MVGLLTVMALWFGGLAAWSDATTLQARWLVSQWRDGKGPVVTPEVWARTRNQLFDGIAFTPGNAQLLEDLGYLHASRAEAFGRHPTRSPIGHYQSRLFREAAAYFRASVQLRPTYPYSWAYLALSKQLSNEIDTEYWLAFDEAYRLGNAEAGVQTALARMAFGHWDSLGSSRQVRIRTMVLTAQPDLGKILVAMAREAKVNL